LGFFTLCVIKPNWSLLIHFLRVFVRARFHVHSPFGRHHMHFYYISIHMHYMLVKTFIGKMKRFSYNDLMMKKDAPLAFRIPADLKKRLQELAKREARSISQVCEILLRLGVHAYEKEGPRYFQRLLSRQSEKDSDQ